MATIVNLAQNFVGSNNVNVLMPIGQFGTRLQGGKDSASPRYIFTMLRSMSYLLTLFMLIISVRYWVACPVWALGRNVP